MWLSGCLITGSRLSVASDPVNVGVPGYKMESSMMIIVYFIIWKISN